MAKTQTRRCVSLSRPVYDRLREYCLKENLSMSSVVERVLLVLLEKADENKEQSSGEADEVRRIFSKLKPSKPQAMKGTLPPRDARF
jgi:hypothetical protein